MIESLFMNDRELPVTIVISGGELTLTERLRHLPGRRSIFRANYNDRVVVAKLYFGKKGTKEYQKEVRGLKELEKKGVSGPKLIYAFQEQSSSILLMDCLSGEVGGHIFRPGENFDEGVLRSLLDFVFDMHEKGVLQRDIHFDNYIFDGNSWFALDVGGMRFFKKRVEYMLWLMNLALFLAQMSPVAASLLEPQIKKRMGRVGCYFVFLLSKRSRNSRLRKIISKSERTCTEFVRVDHRDGTMLVRRSGFDKSKRLTQEGLDECILRGEILKDGNSATVSKVNIEDELFIIKRYQAKNWKKWLSRQFHSRALNAWRNEVFLSAIGVNVPRSIMMFSKKNGPFVGDEYLVTEYIENQADLDIFDEQEKLELVVFGFMRILQAMKEYAFIHGDSKWSNFILNRKLFLIDLDGMRRFVFVGLNRKLKKQEERFLRNWSFDQKKQIRPCMAKYAKRHNVYF